MTIPTMDIRIIQNFDKDEDKNSIKTFYIDISLTNKQTHLQGEFLVSHKKI